jgi:putative membrane protein
MKRLFWLITFCCVFLWSAIGPFDRITWLLEVAPAVIGLVVLIATYKPFPLTTLVYSLILIHCIILMVGGHYTYAEVPLFNELKELMGSSRNNYDKVGHLAQGFIPAMITREIVIRKNVFNNTAWQNFFIVCFSLAFSAFYELIEWAVALISGEGAHAFLGTQGYIWDTQSDMGYALVGAILSLILFSRYHDKQLRQLPQTSA